MSILKKYQPTKENYKVTFSYPANEGINTVQVLGDFNNWDSNQAPKLKKGKEGFSTSLELNAGNSYEFKYLINDSHWENDSNADQYVPSLYVGVENSLLNLEAVKATSKPTASVKTIKIAKSTPTAKVKVENKTKTKTDATAGVKTVKVVVAKSGAKKPVIKPSAK